jgi:hypothetical protein
VTAEGDAQRANATRALVKKYAFEAYPEWGAAHPDKACPSTLSELDEYIARGDLGTRPGDDAWGHTFRMFCGPSLPPGAKGVAVLSLGADGKEGTADDIKSWE